MQNIELIVKTFIYRNASRDDEYCDVITSFRPIMKEYQFTPSSKMLTITEGLEVTLEMIAERVSFRLVLGIQ